MSSEVCSVCGDELPKYPMDRHERDICDSHCAAFRRGMVVGAAIIAWAQAILDNEPRAVERAYWTSELDGELYYNCRCQGCGDYMKALEAGKDEGTDNERCGACRY